MTSYGRFSFTEAGRSAETPDNMGPRAFDLFPTRIWQSRLKALSGRFADWTAAVEAMRAAAPEPAGRTNRGGWNSADHAVLDSPVFAELRQAIVAQCRYPLREMGIDADFRLQSWINIHDRGGFNFQHLHEGCRLSGTFYLQVPKGSGALVLRDPRPGVANSFAKGPVANGYRDIQLKPEAGLLVMFPHWLEHFVEPHQSDIPRIAIPLNLID